MPGPMFLQKEKLFLRLKLKLKDRLLNGLDDASEIIGGFAILDNNQI
jgi:hypothetical protein